MLKVFFFCFSPLTFFPLVDGEGWVKLRNDDFSDFDEHYLVRSDGDWRLITDDGIPILSGQLLHAIKSMMKSDPAARRGLKDIMGLEEVIRVKEGMRSGRLRGALAEEEEGILGRLFSVDGSELTG